MIATKTNEEKRVIKETYHLAPTALRNAVLYYMGLDDGVVELTEDGIKVRTTQEVDSARVSG